MKTHTTGCPALLLADDNPAVLATLVEMLKLEYRIVASLFNGVSVLDQIDLLCPDILMLDLCLGG
jgi:CheY-like chemotaxis protein